MKTRLMKTVSALLAVVMLLGMLPFAVLAESITVNSVEIGDPVRLNVAYTERQIYAAIGNDYYLAPDEAGYTVDPANSYLAYETAWGSMNGASEEVAISTEKTYYACLTLELKSGYDWPEGMKTNTDPDFSGFTVVVDGNAVDLSAEEANYSYNDYWNTVYFCVSAGEVGTEGVVTDITVAPEAKSMAKGESFTFTETVEGTAEKTVVWAVEGNASANTEIDENGKLTVGADETATTLTVLAISTVDDTKIGTATVTVLAEAPTMNLSGIPSNTTMYPNDASSVGVYITGTETNRELVWTLSGNESAQTTIEVYDMYQSGADEWFQSCQVKIGNNETAETVTLTVRSVAHPEVAMTMVITVLAATEVSEIRLVLDTDEAALKPTKTEGEVGDAVGANLFFASSGIFVGNVYLMYDNSGSWNGIGDGLGLVDLNKTYGIQAQIKLKTGYAWPSDVVLESSLDLDVYLNDALVEVASWEYNSYYNSVNIVFVPKLVDAEFTGASLTLGSDLSLNYKVEIYDEAAVDTAKLAVKFTFNGDEYLVKSYIKDGDVYKFRFPGIAPQQMVDEIDAQLVLLGDGDTVAEVLDVKDNYSVKDYLAALKQTNEDPKIDQLISDMVAYGRAAQIYKDYNVMYHPGSYISYTPSEALPQDSDQMVVTGNEDATCKILSVGVRYDVVNKVFVKVYSESEFFKIVVDSVEYTAADCELVAENTYKLSLEPLTAANLSKRYDIELWNDEAETVTTLAYGAYAYVKAVYDNPSASDAQKELALALYRYGQSAAALLG